MGVACFCMISVGFSVLACIFHSAAATAIKGVLKGVIISDDTVLNGPIRRADRRGHVCIIDKSRSGARPRRRTGSTGQGFGVPPSGNRSFIEYAVSRRISQRVFSVVERVAGGALAVTQCVRRFRLRGETEKRTSKAALSRIHT